MKYISLIGVMIMFISCAFNCKQILKGRARPNLISYILWALTPLIGSIAALSEGITWSYLPLFAGAIASTTLFICAALKKDAFFKFQKLDILCGIVSVLALIIWYITKNSMTAIGISIVSDFMSCLPTIIKTWKYPETEPSLAWLGYSVAAWTGIVAIEIWNFLEVSYPLYLALCNTFIFIIIVRKKNRLIF